MGACLNEADRLATLIERIPFLARAEDPRGILSREAVDVGSELALVREFYGASAKEAGVTLGLHLGGRPRADPDRTPFQRAVGNLVTNAIAHTPVGGRVTIAATSRSGGLEVSVADNGRGIAPEHVPRLFDRVYRCDPTGRPAGEGWGWGWPCRALKPRQSLPTGSRNVLDWVQVSWVAQIATTPVASR